MRRTGRAGFGKRQECRRREGAVGAEEVEVPGRVDPVVVVEARRIPQHIQRAQIRLERQAVDISNLTRPRDRVAEAAALGRDLRRQQKVVALVRVVDRGIRVGGVARARAQRMKLLRVSQAMMRCRGESVVGCRNTHRRVVLPGGRGGRGWGELLPSRVET